MTAIRFFVFVITKKYKYFLVILIFTFIEGKTKSRIVIYFR